MILQSADFESAASTVPPHPQRTWNLSTPHPVNPAIVLKQRRRSIEHDISAYEIRLTDGSIKILGTQAGPDAGGVCGGRRQVAIDRPAYRNGGAAPSLTTRIKRRPENSSKEAHMQTKLPRGGALS
jgi:hypothetical protein